MNRQGGDEGAKGDEATQPKSPDRDALPLRPRIGSRGCVPDVRCCTAARSVEDNSVRWQSSANQGMKGVALRELSDAHR